MTLDEKSNSTKEPRTTHLAIDPKATEEEQKEIMKWFKENFK